MKRSRGDLKINFVVDSKVVQLKILKPDGSEIAADGYSDGKGISISADDRSGGAGGAAAVVSGPGKIEIFKGEAVPANLIGSNDDDFPEQHAYSKTDPGLSVLDQLPEGLITVKVTDQADNETSVIFAGLSLPFLLDRLS